MASIESDPIYIAVVGGAECDDETAALAYEVGRLLAEAKAILVCGGLGGVMEAASRGAREAGGVTVGILPDNDRTHANRYLDIALATGTGEARNTLIVRAADAVVAVGGEFGTLSEISFALKIGKPVVGIRTWELAKDGEFVDAIERAASAAEAVDRVLAMAR